MKIESSAFGSHQAIPKKHSGEGKDISPPLKFMDVPTKAKSLVLIVDDPDAPMGTFDHWLTWNISPVTKELHEGDKGPVEGMIQDGTIRDAKTITTLLYYAYCLR